MSDIEYGSSITDVTLPTIHFTNKSGVYTGTTDPLRVPNVSAMEHRRNSIVSKGELAYIDQKISTTLNRSDDLTTTRNNHNTDD